MARISRLVIPAVLIVVALTGATLWVRRAPAPASSTVPRRGGELVASCRTEPSTFNRFLPEGSTTPTEIFSLLTQAKLVRINRATDEVEPWLAERWTLGSDGQTYTVKLRRGVKFSDGAPFSSADVVFSFETVYGEPAAANAIGGNLKVADKPLDVAALDADTVVIKFPSPFGPGLELLDNLPILPKHKLEDARRRGQFAKAWTTATPPSEMAGLGAFVLTEYVPGQRMSFGRNPHYWRVDASGTPLPYLDRIVVQFVPDHNAEVLRLETGQLDLMAQGEIRPEDYSSLKRAADAGRLRLIDVGVSLDPNLLWFNLNPKAKASDPRRAWLLSADFRKAISHAVDRTAMLNAVFLGAGVPIYGPVTPGNTRWYSSEIPKFDYDPARAAVLLDALSLKDRNGDGAREDETGQAVRFALLTQRGHSIRERSALVLQEQLRKIGVTVDVLPLDTKSMIQRVFGGDYDAVYYGFQFSSTDPANQTDFWLSSGGFHVWNRGQSKPETDWERQIDELMQRQAVTTDLPERKRLFTEVQRIFAEQQPALYFVAPRIIVAVSNRVANATPAILSPQILWNADSLAARGGT